MYWVLGEPRTGIMGKEPQAWGGLREEIPEKKILFYWVLKDE